MDVHDAAYRVAHDYQPPQGAVALARKMGRNPGTFLNQLNPAQETAKLGLGDAVAMSIAADDYRILHAFADSCGFVAFPKPDLSRISDASLLEMILKRDRAEGEFAEVLARALDNGDVSAGEFVLIEKEAYESAAATLELVERIKGLRRGD